MGCCNNTGTDLAKKPQNPIPIPENYIRRIEEKLLKKITDAFDGVFQDGRIIYEILDNNIEKSECEGLFKQFMTERGLDYKNLIYSYLLISEMPSIQKCFIISNFTDMINRSFLNDLISTLVDLSTTVLPFLSYYESKLNSYPIEHYLTGILSLIHI